MISSMWKFKKFSISCLLFKKSKIVKFETSSNTSFVKKSKIIIHEIRKSIATIQKQNTRLYTKWINDFDVSKSVSSLFKIYNNYDAYHFFMKLNVTNIEKIFIYNVRVDNLNISKIFTFKIKKENLHLY